MDTIEIFFDEVILDNNLYVDKPYQKFYNNAREFGAGDFIIYFRGNNTWRAEVIKKTKNGYIVRDY